MTLAAVVVALVSSNRSQRATERAEADRVIDHEVDRRLVTITAIADVWRDVTDLGQPVLRTVELLDDEFPEQFRPGEQGRDELMALLPRLGEEVERFQLALKPYAVSSFRAEALVSGALRDSFEVLDDVVKEVAVQHLGLLVSMREHHQRPDTAAFAEAWARAKAIRPTQVEILRDHYSVDREVVRRQLRL